MAPTPENMEDYSASSTVTTFDHPIPLLRIPIPATSSSDLTKGPYLLAFKDHHTFHVARKSTISKIVQQCEAGARIGCAISASKNCRTPWWRALIGPRSSFSEKAECEEREMEACLVLAKERCVGFAEDKCSGPFAEAKVADGRCLTKCVSEGRDLLGSDK